MKRFFSLWSQTGWLIGTLLVISATAGANGLPQLIEAVKNQDTAKARALIKSDTDVNATQGDGATALHWAVHRDDIQTAELLIKAGADVNAINDFGVMPLYLAGTNRNAAMAKLLLNAGAKPNAAVLTGETVLMRAAHAGDLATVEALLEHGANIGAKEPVRHQTALMWALGENNTDVAKLLIKHGADINATTTLGFTPLLFACRKGNYEIAKLLLDAEVEVNTIAKPRGDQTYLKNTPDKSVKGLSALMIAAHRGHEELVALLCERGADVDYDGPGYNALHWACGSWETELNGINGMRAPSNHEWHQMSGVKDGQFEMVKTLLVHGADPNARLKKNPSRYGFTVASTRPTGSTPYIIAAMAGEADIMRLLVEQGADPKLKPSNGTTALLVAAGVGRHTAENVMTEEESVAACAMALELGADVNETDPNGNTAMHGAAWTRAPKLVQFLADNGGKALVKNKYKQTPLYIADHNGRFAGLPPKIDRLPVGHLLFELEENERAQGKLFKSVIGSVGKTKKNK
jgi:ankyrin repeat protein